MHDALPLIYMLICNYDIIPEHNMLLNSFRNGAMCAGLLVKAAMSGAQTIFIRSKLINSFSWISFFNSLRKLKRSFFSDDWT